MNESPKRRRSVHNSTETSSKEKKDKPKRKKSLLLTILKIVIIVGILGFFVVAGAAAGLVSSVVKDLPKIDPSTIESMLDENSVVLDSNGDLLQKVQDSGVIRTKVELKDIDQDLINAFIATEDRTFYTHNGFNFRRLVGATIEGIKTFSMPRGTSTLTQQLARNIYLPKIKGEKSLDRKIKEAYYAIQIEKYLSKDQILQAYLNTIFLGGDAYGVQAAAQTYFSKDASDLEIHEAALIGGITQNPNRNKPFLNKLKKDVKETDYIIDDSDDMYTLVFNESSLDRYKLILYNMKQFGAISEEEYEAAKNIDLKTTLKPGKKKNDSISSSFTDIVTNDVIKDMVEQLGITKEEAKKMLYTQGLKVHSTLDVSMQKKLEAQFANNANFPELDLKLDNSGNIQNKDRSSVILYKKDNVITQTGNLVIPKSAYDFQSNGDLKLYRNKIFKFIPLYNDKNEVVNYSIRLKDTYILDEKILYTYQGGSLKISSEYKSLNNKDIIISKDFLQAKPDFFVKDEKGNLLVEASNFSISNTPTVQPQSSGVIIDYTNGEVKALIGGRNIRGQKQLNRAVRPRQPGSSIKPLAVYGPALDNGYTAGSIIDDVPHYDNKGNRWPKNWYEKSYDRKNTGYWGLQTLRDALKWSQNVTAVKVVEDIGVNTSINYLKKLGVSTLDLQGGVTDITPAAMALGGMSKGISPLEMTAAFGSIANRGVYVTPKTYTKVTDKYGNVVIENKALKHKVYSAETAFLLTDIMKDGGATGAKARLTNMPMSGKTGTTTSNFDAWFVGFSPYYVSSIWIGNDLNYSMTTGSKASAALWGKVMNEVHKDLTPKNFPEKPASIVSVPIDIVSGKLATDLTSRDPRGSMVRNEYFVKGTEPTEYDDVHVELTVCSYSNKLATNYCPDHLIGSQVFIRRPEPFNPDEHDGFTPRDHQYEVPLEYCDIHNFMPDYFNNNTNTNIYSPTNAQVLPNGTVIYPDGTKVYPNGVVISPNTVNDVDVIDNTMNNN